MESNGEKNLNQTFENLVKRPFAVYTTFIVALLLQEPIKTVFYDAVAKPLAYDAYLLFGTGHILLAIVLILLVTPWIVSYIISDVVIGAVLKAIKDSGLNSVLAHCFIFILALYVGVKEGAVIIAGAECVRFLVCK